MTLLTETLEPLESLFNINMSGDKHKDSITFDSQSAGELKDPIMFTSDPQSTNEISSKTPGGTPASTEEVHSSLAAFNEIMQSMVGSSDKPSSTEDVSSINIAIPSPSGVELAVTGDEPTVVDDQPSDTEDLELPMDAKPLETVTLGNDPSTDISSVENSASISESSSGTTSSSAVTRSPQTAEPFKQDSETTQTSQTSESSTQTTSSTTPSNILTTTKDNQQPSTATTSPSSTTATPESTTSISTSTTVEDDGYQGNYPQKVSEAIITILETAPLPPLTTTVNKIYHIPVGDKVYNVPIITEEGALPDNSTINKEHDLQVADQITHKIDTTFVPVESPSLATKDEQPVNLKVNENITDEIIFDKKTTDALAQMTESLVTSSDDMGTFTTSVISSTTKYESSTESYDGVKSNNNLVDVDLLATADEKLTVDGDSDVVIGDGESDTLTDENSVNSEWMLISSSNNKINDGASSSQSEVTEGPGAASNTPPVSASTTKPEEFSSSTANINVITIPTTSTKTVSTHTFFIVTKPVNQTKSQNSVKNTISNTENKDDEQENIQRVSSQKEGEIESSSSSHDVTEISIGESSTETPSPSPVTHVVKIETEEVRTNEKSPPEKSSILPTSRSSTSSTETTKSEVFLHNRENDKKRANRRDPDRFLRGTITKKRVTEPYKSHRFRKFPW